MTQVQLNIALSLDLQSPSDRDLLTRLIGPHGPVPMPVEPAQLQVPPEAPPAKARKAKVDTSVTGVLGPPEDTSNGFDHDDDMGLDPDAASLSPTEAKDQGLAVVREIHKVNPGEVKLLQRRWGISKFYDIPVERGHEFYREVIGMATKLGL